MNKLPRLISSWINRVYFLHVVTNRFDDNPMQWIMVGLPRCTDKHAYQVLREIQIRSFHGYHDHARSWQRRQASCQVSQNFSMCPVMPTKSFPSFLPNLSKLASISVNLKCLIVMLVKILASTAIMKFFQVYWQACHAFPCFPKIAASLRWNVPLGIGFVFQSKIFQRDANRWRGLGHRGYSDVIGGGGSHFQTRGHAREIIGQSGTD